MSVPSAKEIREVMNHVESVRCDNLFKYDSIKKNAFEIAVSVLGELFWQAKEKEKEASE